jgi:hypothetical protein
MRRLLAWPIALPLAVIGTLTGHSVGYRAAVPDGPTREHLLATTGHGYLEYAPLVVGLGSVAVLLAFCAAVVSSFRRRRIGSSVHVVLVAAIPPLAFVAQEFLERYLHDGRFGAELLVSAPFLVGLAVQLPFALLAAAIAYALTAVARRLGTALAARRRRPRHVVVLPAFGARVGGPRRSALSRGYTGRGPPLAAGP